MNRNERQGTIDDIGICIYCGGPMAATVQICFACGLPRPKVEAQVRLRLPAPSRKHVASQRAYVPYAEQYSALADAEPASPTLPGSGRPGSEDNSAAMGKAAAKERWARFLRGAATVLVIAGLASAMIVGASKVWQQKASLSTYLEFRTYAAEIRAFMGELKRLYDGESLRNDFPHYSATPVSKGSRVKRTAADADADAAAADSPAAPVAPARPSSRMGVHTQPISAAPSASGAGTVKIQITPPLPMPGIQNSTALSAPSQPDQQD